MRNLDLIEKLNSLAKTTPVKVKIFLRSKIEIEAVLDSIEVDSNWIKLIGNEPLSSKEAIEELEKLYNENNL